MWIAAYPLIGIAILPPDIHGGLSHHALATMALCFAYYATLSAGLAFLIPMLTRRIDPAVLLGLAGLVGAGGLAALSLINSPLLLIPCFTALAVGWCALSNLPYALASKLVPEAQSEHWFRVFAFSTIMPQLAVSAALVLLIGELDPDGARRIMLVAGGMMATGSLLSLLFRRQLSIAPQS